MYILVFIFMTICASSPYLTSFSITLAGFSEDPSQKLNRTLFMTSFFCDIYLVKSCSYTYSTHFIIDAPKRLQKFILQKFLSLVMSCDFPCFSVTLRDFPCYSVLFRANSVLFRAIPCFSVLFRANSVLIRAFSCFSVIFRAFPLHGDTRKSTRYGLGGTSSSTKVSA